MDHDGQVIILKRHRAKKTLGQPCRGTKMNESEH
jgi:hypothetical protein